MLLSSILIQKIEYKDIYLLHFTEISYKYFNLNIVKIYIKKTTTELQTVKKKQVDENVNP